VIVAGASFAGIACAKTLAAMGCSVLVMERRADISKGIRTTGILVDEAISLVNAPPGAIRPISQVRLYGPSMRYVEAASNDYMFYATDTPVLMQSMVNDATRRGVAFLFDTPFIDGRREGNLISVNGGFATCRFLVGADGAQSRVAAAFGLGKNRQFLTGVEAEYTGVSLENPDAFYCLLDKRYAPGYIGWIVPGPKVLQIGLAVSGGARPDIAKLIERVSPLLRLDKPEIVERRGGLIPVGGRVTPFYNENVIVTGDAAGIVSPLTAGGIHTALHYGHRLGELLAAHVQAEGPHPGPVLDLEYPRFRTKRLLRGLFDRMPNACFDALVASPLSQPVANAVFFLKKRLPKPRRRKAPPLLNPGCDPLSFPVDSI
jgi:digeranylgeranylglycerophospholipid reductase